MSLYYSDLKNVQIIIALLKKYNIKHLVLSAGTRHTPFVFSVEQDPFFTCYSIVDERSAGFFGLGLIQQLGEPVAIACTSGTAVSNYLTAVSEAFYQQLPLVVITADRNYMYKYQQEEQMVPQTEIFKGVCKREVTLPIVANERDFWYCQRLVNEALLETQHKDKGPVHINYPVENDNPEPQVIFHYDTQNLPEVKKIERLTLEDNDETWKKWTESFKNKKIFIAYGQYRPLNDKEIQVINNFCQKFDCIIATDCLSNLKCNKSIDTYILDKALQPGEKETLAPDILITMNANNISQMRFAFKNKMKSIRHVHVSAEGEICDPFKCLPDLIECKAQKFFEKFSEFGDENATSNYFNIWNNELKRAFEKNDPATVKLNYSSVYAIQQVVNEIPENSILHIANSNSIRLASYFTSTKDIPIYCNRGTNGIDGSMSSFMGNAAVSGKLSFLLIGDLSFFYDMNALWNRYVNKNIRILLTNNSGGGIFHAMPVLTKHETLNRHISASHNTSAKGWVESRGFEYLCAHNKEEFDVNIEKFFDKESDKPIFFECFTDMDEDAKELNAFCNNFATASGSLRNAIKSHLSPEMKETLKKMMGKQ